MLTQKQLMDTSSKQQSTVFAGMSLSANQTQTRRLNTCINHACMQHMGHVGAWAAEMVHARGSCASRKIIHISEIMLVHAFNESVFSHQVSHIRSVRYSQTCMLDLRTALFCVCCVQGFGSVGVQPTGSIHVDGC